MTTLTLAHGTHAHTDRARLVTLSNEGKAWQNNGKTMRGEPGPASSWGRLDYDLRKVVAAADYVIYSYQTPIAWRVNGAWSVTTESYSRTTARHITHARALLSRPGCVS